MTSGPEDTPNRDEKLPEEYPADIGEIREDIRETARRADREAALRGLKANLFPEVDDESHVVDPSTPAELTPEEKALRDEANGEDYPPEPEQSSYYRKPSQ